ncbi:MAG: hypothetical protein IKJ18_02615 [Bacteroidaceae bacterium]|nr:hypothetical protein [Bacteroidaceae bacterium]
MRNLRIISVNISFSIICSILLSACQDTYELDDNVIRHYTIDIDATSKGEVIPNVVSNLNVWNMSNTFKNPSPNEENNIFDFVEYIQLMTATGGSQERDLFQDPNDKSTLEDYKFEGLIENCRGILSLGCKPHIKLGNVPSKFTKEYKTAAFGVNVYAPENYEAYYNYIKAIVQALADTFGKEEVKRWHWGVFTEYENSDWFVGTDETPENTANEFCKLYDWTVQAVIDVLGEDVYIGAHSMTVTEGLWDEEIFIRHVATGKNHCTGKVGTRISYLSTSFYDVEPGIPTSGKQLAECIGYLKTTAEKYGLTDLTYGVDEGRILYGKAGTTSRDLFSRTVGHTYMAAYDARLYAHLLNSGGTYLSSWDYLSESLFDGNPSISYHVAKNIHAMAGMSRLQTVIRADKSPHDTEVGTIAGIDQQSGKMCIMVYNFGNSLTYAAKADMHLSIKTESEKEEYNVSTFKVDDDCNWFDEWMNDCRKLGIEDSMFKQSPDDACGILHTLNNEWAKEQYRALLPKYKLCSKLESETSTISSYSPGTLIFDVTLPPNTVWFIHVE